MNSNSCGSLLIGISLLACSPLIQAADYEVPATANIHSAGLSVPVAPGGGGAGTLPVLYGGVIPGSAFQFTATGSVDQFFGLFYHGPDGLPGYSADVYPYGGLSGFKTDQLLSLVGVFLSDSLPITTPATLDFGNSGIGQNFLTLSPSLGQIFFIGDGVNSGGQPQTFFAPAGTTRLFLGFADCPDSLGLPGSFDDNNGSLHVSIIAVPEPASIALLVVGIAAGLVRRKK